MSLKYRIVGNDMQMVEINLLPGETVIADAGTMTYMEDGVSFNVSLSDGSENRLGFMSRLVRAGKRALAKESFFLTHFTNESSEMRSVAFSAPNPGKIVPVDLLSDTENGVLICQKDAFLCAEYGTGVDIAFTKRLTTGFFGGEGFILEKLYGNGLVFIHAGGTIIERDLNNESLTIDSGCIVAFEDSVDFSVEPVGGLKSMLFGGEGVFFATLSGNGKVFLQSLPFSRLVDRIISSVPVSNG